MYEENSSGLGEASQIPEGVKGWSWGAFLLNWIWGIGNNTYRAFWVLVPIFGIYMMFRLGFKGREWAWKHNKWMNVEHFNRVQKQWNIAALVLILSSTVLFGGLFYGITGLMKGSYAYKKSFAQVRQNPQVIERLGIPIESSIFVSGNIRMNNTSGHANISYGLEGPLGEVDVFVVAEQTMGVWEINCLDLTFKKPFKRITLVQCDTNMYDVFY